MNTQADLYTTHTYIYNTPRPGGPKANVAMKCELDDIWEKTY